VAEPRSSPSKLVQHDIELTRVESATGTHVHARVMCKRRGETIPVEACRGCPHFSHFEVHEAGYVMWCRECDEEA